MSTTKKQTTAPEVMVVNDSPGEECRVAIMQDNHLEELFSERTATATNVGNIYKGRVTNVERAIQAAFVDYGEGQAGFLHISDLHPRYFPGSKVTERVGKKIPRRSRPPIQDALRRGDEVLVQVLKEGIGTKGPTLTSYLSVPGRLLVMMPDMDRVGVSRKVEDPDKRREMRQILDTLDLPDNFGFILRTAGFDKSKTDLNRDVAYLTRLWKVMEKRIKEVGAPCELYTESDLFVRTIRDVLRPSIEAIVVDSQQAYDRGMALLRVVAPRSATSLVRYRGKAPIFHTFDIERQIDLIHHREVPLPSGGKLVIDQTEALVAIDVNSGRSRGARDSETNAYETNCEAVDEICRQLRLRDLGGLVINDLIDMHAARHRREIEERFKQGLARDRARTTMLKISEFGIVELTRQRMRPSLRKSHFMPCSHCDGHGEIKTPESVGSDATRHASYLVQFDRVRRLEIVCSPRVASVLLSAKRRELVHLEDDTGKKIDVRVSDAIAVDRVDFYAYDERNADVDVAKLPSPQPPTIKELLTAEREPEPAAEAAPATGKKRRRRRKSAPADGASLAMAVAGDLEPPDTEPQKREEAERPSRRRRRGRKKTAERAAAASAPAAAPAPEAPSTAPIRIHQLAKELGVKSRDVLSRCRDRIDEIVKNHMSSISPASAEVIRKEMRRSAATASPATATPATATPAATEGNGPRKKRSRRSRKRGGRGRQAPATTAAETPAATEDAEKAAENVTDQAQPERKKTRRRRSRRKTGSEVTAGQGRSGRRTPGKAESAAKTEPAAAVPAVVNGKNGESDEPRPRKGLYGRSRRKLTRTAAQQLQEKSSE